MKYFLLLISFFTSTIYAQNCRYLKPIFSTTTKLSNVVYATAFGIPTVYVSENITTNQNLTADIFTPDNDTLQSRALIIFAHSGGFLTGSKDNQDMQLLCDSFAKCGYVTATINYRMNFNVFSSTSAERAVWRATQDASSAVRYFKQNASTYKIDTSKIFFWGSSAGSFMALNLAYLEDNEKPASVSNSPNLGCKNCSGLSTPNHNETIAGIVSCWGAIGDTNWINSNNNTAAIMFHGTSDAYVSIDQAHPFSLSTLPITSGSNLINQRLNNLSIYHEFYPAVGEAHEYWGTTNGSFGVGQPTSYWIDIIEKSKKFMLQRMGMPTTCTTLAIAQNKLKIKQIKENDIILVYQTNDNADNLKYIAQYSFDGIVWSDFSAVFENNLPKNEIEFYHSFNKTKKKYFYRINTIETNGSNTYSNIVVFEKNSDSKELIITPNPAKQYCNIIIDNASVIFVSDIFGRIVYKYSVTNSNNTFSFNTSILKSNTYFVKVVLKNGTIITKQLIVLN